MVCKSCKIGIKKKPRKEYSYPKDIPVSKEMKKRVEDLKRKK